MKKVLVITYYWPPTGGSGVQRWLKFCKYLRNFGWEPVVYTPEDPDVDLVDPSLRKDVHPEQLVLTLPIREPRRVYRSLFGSSAGGQADEILYVDPHEWSLKQKALVWARSNLLIPDARALWIEPSVEFLTEYLQHYPVDAMVSTGPPHSMHLIAKGVKAAVDIPWVADFRDPWTQIAYYNRLPLTTWADKKHRALEQSVIDTADALVEIAPSSASRLRMAGGRRVETITNGYDPDEIPIDRKLRVDKFRINHTGVLTADRNHEVFWEALRAVSKGVMGFTNSLEIELVGRVDPSVREMARRFGLESNVVTPGYIPHQEAIDRMASAHVLFLAINQTHFNTGILPGKMFEYMALRRPILMIGPVMSDAVDVLRETNSGESHGYESFHDIKSTIAKWYEQSKTGELTAHSRGIEAYSRKHLTERMAGLLDELTGQEKTPS